MKTHIKNKRLIAILCIFTILVTSHTLPLTTVYADDNGGKSETVIFTDINMTGTSRYYNYGTAGSATEWANQIGEHGRLTMAGYRVYLVDDAGNLVTKVTSEAGEEYDTPVVDLTYKSKIEEAGRKQVNNKKINPDDYVLSKRRLVVGNQTVDISSPAAKYTTKDIFGIGNPDVNVNSVMSASEGDTNYKQIYDMTESDTLEGQSLKFASGAAFKAWMLNVNAAKNNATNAQLLLQLAYDNEFTINAVTNVILEEYNSDLHLVVEPIYSIDCWTPYQAVTVSANSGEAESEEAESIPVHYDKKIEHNIETVTTETVKVETKNRFGDPIEKEVKVQIKIDLCCADRELKDNARYTNYIIGKDEEASDGEYTWGSIVLGTDIYYYVADDDDKRVHDAKKLADAIKVALENSNCVIGQEFTDKLDFTTADKKGKTLYDYIMMGLTNYGALERMNDLQDSMTESFDAISKIPGLNHPDPEIGGPLLDFSGCGGSYVEYKKKYNALDDELRYMMYSAAANAGLDTELNAIRGVTLVTNMTLDNDVASANNQLYKGVNEAYRIVPDNQFYIKDAGAAEPDATGAEQHNISVYTGIRLVGTFEDYKALMQTLPAPVDNPATDDVDKITANVMYRGTAEEKLDYPVIGGYIKTAATGFHLAASQFGLAAGNDEAGYEANVGIFSMAEIKGDDDIINTYGEPNAPTEPADPEDPGNPDDPGNNVDE